MAKDKLKWEWITHIKKGELISMLPFDSNFWISFLIVFVLVLLMNYVSKTFFFKKKFKLSIAILLVSVIQSFVITFLIGKLI